MPVVDMLKTSNEGNVIFYDIEASVGRSGANRRGDVLLVQFLLITALKNELFKDAGAAPVQANGVPDQPTMDAILLFQKQLRKQGRAYAVVDGRFDPVGEHAKTPSGAQYAMITLNMAFDSIRPDSLKNLAGLKDCPAELKPLLTLKFITA